MNGRVYDYNLGRFMSVDPFVHGGSQGINPYSYIMNNPLAGTDPSGYSPETVDVNEKTKFVKDKSGNVYVDEGESLVKVEQITAEGGGKIAVANIEGGSFSSIFVSNGNTFAFSNGINTFSGDVIDLGSRGQITKAIGDVLKSGADTLLNSFKSGGKFGLTLALAIVPVNQTKLEDGTPAGELSQEELDNFVPSSSINYNELGGMRNPTPPEDPNDDEYENPGHHDPSGGPNNYNRTKAVLPQNHQELWKASQRVTEKTRWTKVGKGKQAVYHRFSSDGKGSPYHWTGSTNGRTANGQPRAIKLKDVPSEVRKW